MTAAFHILTLTPIKKGRKYFTCTLPERGYTVKLVINDLTDDLALNAPVSIRARDLSRHSIFGSQTIYEAMQVLRGRTTVADKIGQEIERSFQKASFRGIEVDSSLGVQGASWRSFLIQMQSGCVQLGTSSLHSSHKRLMLPLWWRLCKSPRPLQAQLRGRCACEHS